MPGRIGGVLGDPDRTEIDLGDQQAFRVLRQFLRERAAVGAVNRGVSATNMQQRMLVRPVT